MIPKNQESDEETTAQGVDVKPKVIKQCDGGCEEHIGIIRHVYSGYNPKTQEPWDWWYCESAIEEDKSRGFVVTDYNSGVVL